MLNQPKFNLGPSDPGPNPFETASADLKKAFGGATHVLILVRENPKLDHVASALSLYLAIKQTEKTVSVACPTEMRVEFNRLVGVDKVSTKIGNRNLVISFPYVKDSIEKVSYNVDEVNFNLVIQPKPAFPALDSTQVQYSYSGAEAQLLFVIGAQKLEDLGIFYANERSLFEQATVVNIDTVPTNSHFGRLNLIWSEFSSCAEITTETIEHLELKLDQDIASNLLAGMNEATQNFQRFNLKATAFEAAAKLMKAGGKRPLGTPAFGAPRQFGSPGLGPALQGFSNSLGDMAAQNPFAPRTFPAPPASIPTSVAPYVNPFTPPNPAPPVSFPGPLATQTTATPAFSEPPLQANFPSTVPAPTATNTDQPQPIKNEPEPDDWLKPKIFTGSTKIS